MLNPDSYGKSVFKVGPNLISGVYFLKLQGEIIYIGKSNNVFQRAFGCEHMAKRFDEVEVHWMPECEILAYEQTQIQIHKPRLNVEGVKPRSAPSYLSLANRSMFAQSLNPILKVRND